MSKPLSEEERKRKRREQRGVPPLPTFSLTALADDVLLTQKEVAAWKRESVTWTEKQRFEKRDGLEWKYIGGRPRCTVKSLKKVMQGDDSVRRPPVKQHAEAGTD